jgi:hypothetical protein
MIERIASREDATNAPQLVITTKPAPVSTTATASADTFLYSGATTATNGTTTPLLLSAGSYRALLRFDTTTLAPSAQVSTVTLRLYATVGLAAGGIQVHPALDSWSEQTVSWSTQPPWNSQVLATSATQTSPGWVSVALPASAVTAGGNTDIGLDYSAAQMIERIASREDAAHAPQLIVTTS